MNTTVVKFQWNNELRRVSVENTQTFEQIGNLIKNLFKDAPASFVLRYRDEDGDVITVSSDIELKEAFKSSPLRFKIVDTTPKKQESKKEQISEESEENPFEFLLNLISGSPFDNRRSYPSPCARSEPAFDVQRLFGIPLVRPQHAARPHCATGTCHAGPFYRAQQAAHQAAQKAQQAKNETPQTKGKEAPSPFWIPIRVVSQPSNTEEAKPQEETPEKTSETLSTTENPENETLEGSSLLSTESTPADESVSTTEPIIESVIEESSEKVPETTESSPQVQERQLTPFESNLNKLESMGFLDREENIRLLVNNGNDVVKAVADLLN